MGVSSADPITLDHEEPERTEGQKSTMTTEEVSKFQLLEKRLQAIEGTDKFGALDAQSLSLVSNLVIPPKFKVPEFEKFNGTTDPSVHIRMYLRKMAGYEKNEKLLIHCFQHSLTGAAARWYIELDNVKIQSWADLAKAFLNQYQHVSDWAPDRLSLMNFEKRSTESFRQYAQRWREEAALVQPPLTEKEMTVTFIHTLRAPYYEKLVGNATKKFADLVLSGEMIDAAIKSGRMSAGETAGSSKKPIAGKKKEEEANAINYAGSSQPRQHQAHNPRYSRTPRSYPVTISPQPIYATNYNPSLAIPSNPPQGYPPQVHQTTNRTTNNAPGNRGANQPRQHFDPIPMTYKELYQTLLQNHLVAPIYVPEKKPPYPPWYNPNAHCEYHAGAAGHDIENCLYFKRNVQNLINAKVLQFGTNQGPNVATNPLPNHTEPAANMINTEP